MSLPRGMSEAEAERDDDEGATVRYYAISVDGGEPMLVKARNFGSVLADWLSTWPIGSVPVATIQVCEMPEVEFDNLDCYDGL